VSWSLLVRMRKQYAVYWAPTGVGDDGEKTFAAPVELKVRWEGVKMLLRTDPLYKDNQTREVVYVGQVVEMGGVLWKGRLAACPAAKKVSPYDPFADDEAAKEITKYTEYPTLNAKKFLRVATL
jgi:hypothetical protein